MRAHKAVQPYLSAAAAHVLRPGRLCVLFSALVGLFTCLFVLEVGPFKRTLLDCTVRSWVTPRPTVRASSYSTSSPRARSLAPETLLDDRDRAGAPRSAVPKLLHQSWKSKTFPKRFAAWSDTWRVRHPDWEHVLWTDGDNRALVERYYPEYLEAYDALPREIYRADMVRNMYMHRYGGVYIDADLECLRPVDVLLAASAPTVFVARMGYDDAYSNSVPNAFLASTPGHPFWLGPLDYVRANIGALDPNLPAQFRGGEANGPEELTGPVPLWRAVNAFEPMALSRLVVLPPSAIFPYSHHNFSDTPAYCVCSAQSATLDPPRCKALYPDAYAISYWSQSWGSVSWAQLNGLANGYAGTAVVGSVGFGLLAGFGFFGVWWWLRARNERTSSRFRGVELEALLSDSDSDNPRSSWERPKTYSHDPKRTSPPRRQPSR